MSHQMLLLFVPIDFVYELVIAAVLISRPFLPAASV